MVKNAHVEKEYGWFIFQTRDGKNCVCTIQEQGLESNQLKNGSRRSLSETPPFKGDQEEES